MKKIFVFMFIFVLLSTSVSAYTPGTTATVDVIEAGYARLEVVVPDGVHFIHLPVNMFDFDLKEGDQVNLRVIPVDNTDRRDELEERRRRLQDRLQHFMAGL